MTPEQKKRVRNWINVAVDYIIRAIWAVNRWMD